jgi:hypothetical protein
MLNQAHPGLVVHASSIVLPSLARTSTSFEMTSSYLIWTR